MTSFPQQIMTSDQIWDPTKFDTDVSFEELIDSFPKPKGQPISIYDDEGNCVLCAPYAPENNDNPTRHASITARNDDFLMNQTAIMYDV